MRAKIDFEFYGHPKTIYDIIVIRDNCIERLNDLPDIELCKLGKSIDEITVDLGRGPEQVHLRHNYVVGIINAERRALKTQISKLNDILKSKGLH